MDAALPATPQTLTSDKPMDSDDDFNSVASSMELGEEMSSSVDFGAAGKYKHGEKACDSEPQALNLDAYRLRR